MEDGKFKKEIMKTWILAILLASSSLSQAEVFYDIKFTDSLAEIKNKYPGANYENVKAAWLKPSQNLIVITGSGIKNRPIILFEKVERSETGDPDDALLVWNVRIIYANPIKLDNFRKKYGSSKCYENEDFDKVCDFPGKAITARLSQNGNHVVSIISHYTRDEQVKMFKESLTRYAKKIQSQRGGPQEPPAAAIN